MNRIEEGYRVSGEESERATSMGLVLRAPASSMQKIVEQLTRIDGVRVIYQKIALYELYISPYPPRFQPERVTDVQPCREEQRHEGTGQSPFVFNRSGGAF